MARNVIILFFAFQIMIPSDLKSDLIRLPFLLEHFEHHNHHSHAGETIGFIDFLTNHYSDNHHKEDHTEHNKLPFHNHHSDGNLYQIVVIDFEPKNFSFLNQHFQENVTNRSIFAQENFPSSVSLSIWKPPQILI